MSKEVKRYELRIVKANEKIAELQLQIESLKSELAELVRVVGMSVDGSSARNKAMEKAHAALQGAQP